ncbi:MAG: ADP-ribosylation factor-like protein [Candidatus Hodarchaeales archaeon]|jgi:GTPase SAR1 family protein
MPIPERALVLINKDYLEKDPADIDVKELSKLEITALKGIGTLYGTKLERKTGIRTVEELAIAEEEQLQNLVNDGISPKLMDKWVVAAKIIYQFAVGTVVPVNVRRTLIAGLAVAGKTSIVRSLQQTRPFTESSPTQGAAIEKLEFLGLNLSVWDLGGQYNFRQMYLDEPKQYLVQTMVLLYVIDVLAPTKINESLEYLEALINKFKYLQESPRIYILYNKCDPNVDVKRERLIDENFKQIELKVKAWTRKQKLDDRIKKFKTSIYDVSSLVTAFSQVFTEISPISRILQDTLVYYSDLHNLQASFLIADNGFVISEHTTRLTKERRDEVFLALMEQVRKAVYDEGGEKFEEAEKSIAVRLDTLGGIYLNIQKLVIKGEEKDVILFFASINMSTDSLSERSRKIVNEQISPWITNFFTLVNKG